MFFKFELTIIDTQGFFIGNAHFLVKLIDLVLSERVVCFDLD